MLEDAKGHGWDGPRSDGPDDHAERTEFAEVHGDGRGSAAPPTP